MITRKQINVRLNPGTIQMLKEIKHEMAIRGFSMSQADVIEESIKQLHKKMDLRKDKSNLD